MIKYVAVICAVILAAAEVSAQTVRRTQKDPGFFIPRQTLDRMYNRQEKLPPVEAMRINGEQAPVVKEMQQKAREEAEQKRLAEQQKAAAEKQRKEAQQRAAQEAEKKRLAEIAEQKAAKEAELEKYKKVQVAEPVTEPLQKERIAPEEKAEPIPQNKQRVADNGKQTPEVPATTEETTKNTTPQKVIAASLPAQKQETKSEESQVAAATLPSATPAVGDDEISYEEIISEYKRDTRSISKSIPFRNDRLKNMIQDYKNLHHKI